MPRFAGATGCARDGSGEVQKGGHSGDDFRTEVREGLGEDSRLSNGAIECGDGGDARAGVAGALGGGGFRLDEVVESVEAVAQVLEFCGERHGADLFGGLAHLLVGRPLRRGRWLQGRDGGRRGGDGRGKGTRRVAGDGGSGGRRDRARCIRQSCTLQRKRSAGGGPLFLLYKFSVPS